MTTPFKAEEDFEKEMVAFANKFKVTLAEHSKKISDYFEISCYHLILRYYEAKGYKLEVQNLIGGKFRYKCSPSGRLPNFSYFKASKTKEEGQEINIFIFHNATVQSAFDTNVFTTPDIVVSKVSTPSYIKNYYLVETRELSYIPHESLVTFCEAKHLTPFPELLVGFIGTVLELKPECISGDVENEDAEHLAPSLLMSGTFGKPTSRIRDSFEKRYYVNLIDNLFASSGEAIVVSPTHINENATLRKKSSRISV